MQRVRRVLSRGCLTGAVQELHASHVESTLLSQVRVAVVGQEIDVWVLGRTRVRLNVGTRPLYLRIYALAYEHFTSYSVSRAVNREGTPAYDEH